MKLSIKKYIHKIGHNIVIWLRANIVDQIIPPRCPVTGDVIDGDDLISPRAWADMQFIIKPLCGCCGLPFAFMEDGVQQGDEAYSAYDAYDAYDEAQQNKSQDSEDVRGSKLLCAACHVKRPVFDKARAVVAYNDGSRKIILSFKHGDQHQCGRAMARLMLRLVENSSHYDGIIPVPLHRRKMIWRRFNQAGLLAKYIGRALDITYMPDYLTRIRYTSPQKDKNRIQRHKNVRRAFRVPDKYHALVKGKNFILVDDVYTTGATLNECAHALKKAGAGHVYAISFARTIAGGMN